MELKEFVTQTLCQIVEGVRAAQAEVKDSGGAVSPALSHGQEGILKAGFLQSRQGQLVQNVQFDVALTVSEGTGSKGGIGVFAGAVTLGSSGQSKAENTSVSRVKFVVPVALPNK